MIWPLLILGAWLFYVHYEVGRLWHIASKQTQTIMFQTRVIIELTKVNFPGKADDIEELEKKFNEVLTT